MKKSRSKGIGETPPEIPAAVMARLNQAFQRPAHPDLPCPDPEMVIGCALGELEAAMEQQIQTHLLTCRDCLDLYLDVHLAQAEAEAPGEVGLEGQTSQPTGWLEAWGRTARETLEALLKPRRLIPALATVSLVALVFILGREDRSKVLPPPQLALEQRQAPMKMTDQSGAPPPGTTVAPPAPALLERRLLASKKPFESPGSAQEKGAAPLANLAATMPIRLDLTEVPAPGRGSRLSYRADRDVFAYLLQPDSSGQLTRLFSGRLEGGKTYFSPPLERLRPSDPAAQRATIYLVAAEQPLPEPPATMPEPENQALKQLQSLFPGAVIRSLTVKLP